MKNDCYEKLALTLNGTSLKLTPTNGNHQIIRTKLNESHDSSTKSFQSFRISLVFRTNKQ